MFNPEQLIKSKNDGLIPEYVLILYGISGDLPEITEYSKLTEVERREFWESRMRNRYGDYWRKHFSKLPLIFGKKEINWKVGL